MVALLRRHLGKEAEARALVRELLVSTRPLWLRPLRLTSDFLIPEDLGLAQDHTSA